jgi:hypothetical protein
MISMRGEPMNSFKNRAVSLSVIFLAFLTIFLQTSAPSVFFGDSGELQVVALCGGVAHPSGYPTFIMLGQVFGGVLGGDQAHRITMMSVFFGALAVCALFLVLIKLGLPVWAALAGSVVYGLSFTFWWSAIRAEVYTISIFIYLVSFWLVLHTFEKPTLARAACAAVCLGLTMTGHLAFAPAVMVLGLMLAFIKPEKAKWPVYWSLLLVSFIAGLTPYLYLVWADSCDYPMNYLDYTIELSTRQFGLTEETFSNPFRRVFWLIGGQESTQTLTTSDWRVMARTSMQLAITEFIYQFGLLAFPVFIIGAWRLLKKQNRKVWALVCIFIASTVFCVALGNRRLLPIFAMPLTITSAIVISFGILAIRDWLAGDRKHLRFREISAGTILLALMIATPHLIRGPWDRSGIKNSMKIVLEAGPEINTVIPTLRGYMGPRIYGERILELVPPNSYVVGKWKIMVLYYLHYVEGMRPDIELDPYYPHHFIRLQRWAEKHDLETHPIVFIGKISGLVDDIIGLTEVPIDENESLYICRGPLKWNKSSRWIKDDSR